MIVWSITVGKQEHDVQKPSDLREKDDVYREVAFKLGRLYFPKRLNVKILLKVFFSLCSISGLEYVLLRLILKTTPNACTITFKYMTDLMIPHPSWDDTVVRCYLKN